MVERLKIPLQTILVLNIFGMEVVESLIFLVFYQKVSIYIQWTDF
jgi:hypothetical protein